MAHGPDTPLRRILTNLVAPATLSTAILYYFGWLRSQTIARQFGYDASLLGLSTQDYILRSVQPVATLAVVGGLLAGPAVVLHRWLASRRQAGDLGRLGEKRATHSLLGVGLLAMFAALIWTWNGFGDAGYPLPVLCAIAAIGVGYGTWLRGTGETQLAPEVVLATTVLAVASLFILTSVYARKTGIDQARLNMERAKTSAVVTVTTAESLNLPGVPEREVDGGYAVTGLSLMFTAGDHHFLLPRDFDRQTKARVHLVPVEGSRLDFDGSWAVPCGGFEDLTPGDVFDIGTSFESAGVRYQVTTAGVERPDGPGAFTGVAVESDDDGGRRLRLVDAALSPDFGARYDAWLVEFRQRLPGVVVGAGGGHIEGATLVALAEAGALRPTATMTVHGASEGRLLFRGDEHPLTDLTVGGAELLIDCPIEG